MSSWKRPFGVPSLTLLFVGLLLCLNSSRDYGFVSESEKQPQHLLQTSTKRSHMSPKTDHRQPQRPQTQQPPYQPLVFGAAHGTTGTRSLYRATCLAGLRSIHYHVNCLRRNATGGLVRAAIGPARPGWVAHTKLKAAWLRMKQCAANATMPKAAMQRDIRSGCPSVQSQIDTMKRLIDQVLSSREVDAVHDSPYAYFPHYILEAAERIRGQPPIVLLTERDPMTWAYKRMTYQDALVCYRGRTCAAARGKDSVAASVSFSLDRCDAGDAIMNCKKNGEMEKGPFEYVVPMKFLQGKNLKERIVDGFREHQNELRTVASYSVNLFEQDPLLLDEILSERLKGFL